MSKQYGLILPGQQKKPVALAKSCETTKPSIFDESSSNSESDDGAPVLKMKKTALSMGPGAMERRMARRMQEKALAEDPTVFQYDELYDEMEGKREAEQQVKAKEPKKPKYIARLMVTAERRKLENELRVERQVQKEREEEGEQYKDKEAFVTAAYRTKLEEMRKMQEEEKRDEYLEAIGDVTKQQNIDGFYRHLYEQKLGTAKEVIKPELTKSSSTMTTTPAAEPEAENDDEIAYKPIKSGKVAQQRAYRKRQASDDDEEEAIKPLNSTGEVKKVHLQNNMDADSDFSIDSSSSDPDSDSDNENAQKDKQKKKDKIKHKNKDKEKTATNAESMDSTKIALNLDSFKKPKDEIEDAATATKGVNKENQENNKVDETPAPVIPPKPKIDKVLIWKKRTVGEVFDAALQRYFERKASRGA